MVGYTSVEYFLKFLKCILRYTLISGRYTSHCVNFTSKRDSKSWEHSFLSPSPFSLNYLLPGEIRVKILSWCSPDPFQRSLARWWALVPAHDGIFYMMWLAYGSGGSRSSQRSFRLLAPVTRPFLWWCHWLWFGKPSSSPLVSSGSSPGLSRILLVLHFFASICSNQSRSLQLKFDCFEIGWRWLESLFYSEDFVLVCFHSSSRVAGGSFGRVSFPVCSGETSIRFLAVIL